VNAAILQSLPRDGKPRDDIGRFCSEGQNAVPALQSGSVFGHKDNGFEIDSLPAD
jgi:hypothetical protein